MILNSIYIEKFRAIRTSEIRLGKELALVGQNSGGKSSILRALNAFFNFEDERHAFETGRHTFQRTSTAIVELRFGNVPAECKLRRADEANQSVRVRLRYKKSAVWQIFANGEWEVAPADLHEQLSAHIRYVYVPLRRDHEVSGWTEDGLLRTAVEAWVKHHTSKRDRISPEVAKITRMIRERTFSGLSKQLRQITPITGGFSFKLDYARQPDYSLLLKDLVLRVTEGFTTVDLQDCGSGTQNMTAFALYSYLAELEGSTYILGIEEPEQNLHPQAQRELLLKLRQMPLQVLFTTHSTVMLDELRHDEVVLCRRSPSPSRGIEVTTTQLQASFWHDNDLNEERYYQFHRRRNSEFFFSNFVILTESPIDGEIVRLLLAQAGLSPTEYAVSFLSFDGVKSLPYIYHLLKQLKLSFVTVLDKDYFIPYLNDDLAASRDGRGFPRYRKEYKTGTLVEQIIPSGEEREKLLDLFLSNHSRAMDVLENSNVFCFMWSLETDLVNSATARESLFDGFNIPEEARTTRSLLIDRSKSLKKLENLLPVVKELQPANLPNSYKRIRKKVPELIKSAVR